uniref:GST N-terminal domain-containing protein n=1 Tax=Setaria viridis TaxID=4556 RepID=A0A4U6T4W9_SETVI|nr:hypothetical protein SEVIR_9G450600v2 [Setaria viridis]
MAAGDAEEALHNPGEKVPSMEHKKKIIGKSLDLIKYIDSNFDGSKLITDVSSS